MKTEYLYLGYVAGTHGIKGEIKLRSPFWYKDKVFMIGKPLYIGKDHEKFIIDGYRTHKDYDLVLLKDYSNINEVLKFVSESVYVIRSELDLDQGDYLESDLIDMEVVDHNQKVIGNITSVRYLAKNKKILVINGNKYLPFEKEFIKNVDLENKKVYINSIKGMF